MLVWRLYDTPIGVATRTTKSGPMPAVARRTLMIRLLLWILGAILLGGIVHLSTVLAMPQTAKQDAYSRLAPLTPVNAVALLPPPTAKASLMPFMDPAFAVAVCRYDISSGPLKFKAPVSQAYTSVDVLHPQKCRPITRSTIAPAGRRSIELDLMTAEQHAQLPAEEDVTAADHRVRRPRRD